MAQYSPLPKSVGSADTLKKFVQEKWLNSLEEQSEDQCKDVIYRFSLAAKHSCYFQDSSFEHREPQSVIAGSSALAHLTKCLLGDCTWQANDNDVFILGAKGNSRSKFETVDVIHREAKSVAELLLSFDLPCCRVAYSNDEIFVSEQALFAIFFKKYFFLDIYSEKTLLKAFSEKDDANSKNYTDFVKLIIRKVEARIEKYRVRGIKPIRVISENTEILLKTWRWWETYSGVEGVNVNYDRKTVYLEEEKIPSLDFSVDVAQFVIDQAQSGKIKLNEKIRREFQRQLEEDTEDEPEIEVGTIQSALEKLKARKQEEKNMKKEDKKEITSAALPKTGTGTESTLAQEREIVAELRKLIYNQTALPNKELRLALHTQIAQLEGILLSRSLNNEP